MRHRMWSLTSTHWDFCRWTNLGFTNTYQILFGRILGRIWWVCYSEQGSGEPLTKLTNKCKLMSKLCRNLCIILPWMRSISRVLGKRTGIAMTIALDCLLVRCIGTVGGHTTHNQAFCRLSPCPQFFHSSVHWGAYLVLFFVFEWRDCAHLGSFP